MKKVLLLCITFFYFCSSYAQKEIAIYWDASYSMKDRKLDRELTFLDNYFKKNSEANVTLVMFSNDILFKNKFAVTNSNWAAIKTELEHTVYDGSTVYSQLFKDKVDEYLLFTDGFENIDSFEPTTQKPIYIISSLEKVNTTNLRLQAELSSGRFVMLNTDLDSKSSEIVEEITSNTDGGFITGTVSALQGKLPNASILNQNTGQGIASDALGNYKIEADAGDVLVFSFLGKKTVSVRVDKADVINISMAEIDNTLDEVTLVAEKDDEDYMVNTGNTKQDSRRLGYAVETIDADEISDQDVNLATAVKGQFTNFDILNEDATDPGAVDISKFLGRGKNMSILLNQYGLVVIDGVPLGQTESNFGGIAFSHDNIINPDRIASVTYLKGLAATNKYGTLGRNGVLLIVTKGAADTGVINKKKDIPNGTTATYSGNATAIEKLPNVDYINALKVSKTIDEAFDNYLRQQKKHGNNPIFYLDAYDYFLGWNNPILSQRVLSNVHEIAFNDATILKAMAYKQEVGGDFSGAVKTYQQILKLEPKHSQSYRNLALAYVNAGNYKEAAKLYSNLDKSIGVNNTVFSGLKKTITNETKNLVALHNNKIDVASMNPKFNTSAKYASRIVVEWNNQEAEFDLNIINPQNRVFEWPHTQSENSQRIFQEKDEGFGLEENYLYAADKGEWKFNVRYFGKTSKDKSPTFLKITTYKNYGKPNQSKKIEVIRLGKKNIEQTVTKVVIR